MNITYDQFNGLAKLEHVYKGEMDEDNIHKCHSVFRTPKGKYRKDWLLADEALNDLTEDYIKQMACEIGYDWYESTYGWN